MGPSGGVFGIGERRLRFFPIFTPSKLFPPFFRFGTSEVVADKAILGFFISGSEPGEDEQLDGVDAEGREIKRDGGWCLNPADRCVCESVILEAGTAGGGLRGSEG